MDIIEVESSASQSESRRVSSVSIGQGLSALGKRNSSDKITATEGPDTPKQSDFVCRSEPPYVKVSIRQVVFSMLILIVLVVFVALIPTIYLWVTSLLSVNKNALLVIDAQIDLFRHLTIEKAVNNISNELSKPLLAVRALDRAIPSEIYLGNITTTLEREILVSRALYSIGLLYPRTSNIGIFFSTSNKTYHVAAMWAGRFVVSLSDDISKKNFTQISFDSEGEQKYISTTLLDFPFIDSVWWNAGIDPYQLFDDGLHWTTVFQSNSNMKERVLILSKMVTRKRITNSTLSEVHAIALVSMTLRTLTSYFTSINLTTANGKMFLADDSLNLIAYASNTDFQNSEFQTGAYSLLNFTNSDIVGSTKMWLNLTNGTHKELSFEWENSRLLFVDVKEITLDGNLRMWVFLLIPPSDFLQTFLDEFNSAADQSRKAVIIVISIELVVLISVSIFGFLSASKLCKTIRVITKELSKVADLSSTGRPSFETDSSIIEIQDLGTQTRQLGHAMKSFQKYVPKTIVKYLISNRLEADVGIAKTYSTVLFLDIQDFTESMESHGISVLIDILHSMFDEFTMILVSNGAIIDKYIGDCIMAVFGIPEKVEDGEKKACQAVTEIFASLEKQNAQFSKKFGFKIGIRIGFHSGIVYAGNVGCSSRLNYTVLGSVVNIASRLEPLNKELGTRVCVTDAIRYKSEDEFAFRCLGWAKIRGISEPVRVHEFLGNKKALETKEIVEKYQAIDSKLMKNLSVEISELETYLLNCQADNAIKTILMKLSSGSKIVSFSPSSLLESPAFTTSSAEPFSPTFTSM